VTAPPPQYSSWTPPPQAQPRNGVGIAAVVTGAVALILSVTLILFFLGGPLGLVAAVLGFIGLSRVRRGEASNRGMCITGIVLGALAVLVSVGVLIALIVGVRVAGNLWQDASTSTVQPAPTSDAAGEGWSQLQVEPGTDQGVDTALTVAAWALPGITRDEWPADRVVDVAGNLAAAVQGGMPAQEAVDTLAAEGLTGVPANVFAGLAVETYCTPDVARSFQESLATSSLGTGT
jgi:hypothetical protein